MKAGVDLKVTSVIIIILLFVIPLGILSYLYFHPRIKIRYSLHQTPIKPTKLVTAKLVTGPWGNLEVFPIVIQPPNTILREYTEVFRSSKKWIFENMDLEEIRLLFLNTGISEKVTADLIKNTKRLKSQDYAGFVTTPPDSILKGFTPEIRTKLYPIIGRNKKNITYYQPYQFESINATDWFLKSQIKSNILKSITPLIYNRNNMWSISDIHLIEPLLTSPTDAVSIFQTLLRCQSLKINLVIEPEDNIKKLIKYWGNLDREEFVAPILDCSQNNGKEEKIDIINLLPPLPRIRLNTFVGAEEYSKFARDCYWSTFNFFNTKSDERFNDPNRREKLFNIIARPLPKGEKPKFGDIVLLKKDGAIIYSCVYVADSLVYAKNGIMPDTPFVFVYLDRIKNFFSINGEVEISYYSRLVGDTISSIVPKTNE